MKNLQTVPSEILNEAGNLLEEYFDQKIDITSIVYLSEPERRNVVLRITVVGPIETLILKQSLPDKSDTDDKEAFARFARDWAALQFLASIPHKAHNVPKFYGGSKKYRFILIEDLGANHVSLVDSLTMPDRMKALSALERFVKSLGSLHAATFNNTNRYNEILGSIDDNSDTIEDDLSYYLNDSLSKLENACNKLGIVVSPETIAEVQKVIENIFRPGLFTVLTHGDNCPDNVFDHENEKELQLIDFEWSFVRSAFLDSTYLRMGMPTCWCARMIPPDVLESLEIIYREELKKTISAGGDDKLYYTAYTEACAFWLLRAMPYIDGIMDKDEIWSSGPVPNDALWKPEENLVRPRFISRLESFIDVATKHNMLPNLIEMATKMLSEVKKMWPDAEPLELYPAFQE